MSDKIEIVTDSEAILRIISDLENEETIEVLEHAIQKLQSKTNELAPCPFCGAEINADDIRCVGFGYGDGNFLSQVICPKCSAGGPVSCERENAAKYWNACEQKGNNDEDQ